jgi:hypothetical protein
MSHEPMVIASLRSAAHLKLLSRMKSAFNLKQPELDLATPAELEELRAALVSIDAIRARYDKAMIAKRK